MPSAIHRSRAAPDSSFPELTWFDLHGLPLDPKVLNVYVVLMEGSSHGLAVVLSAFIQKANYDLGAPVGEEKLQV